MRLIRVLAAAALFLALALPVSANEITSLSADCGTGIVASGTHFEAVTVTLTGPGYSKSAAVQGDWSHTFPLGANGSYSLDWPDSAEFGPVALTVRCATPQRPTPGRETPGRTLPPTDVDGAAGPMGPQGAGTTAADGGQWWVYLLCALVGSAMTGVILRWRRPCSALAALAPSEPTDE